MFSRFTRMTFLAAAASLLLSGPTAMAKGGAEDPACAELQNSVLPAPDWFAERCLGGNAVTDYSQYQEYEGFVPGDIAWYKNNFPAPQNVKTAPLTTLTFTNVGANAQPLFAMQWDLPATTLYAVDNTSRQLGTINQTTGAFVPIAAINPDPGAAFTVLGLAFDNTAGGQAYLSLSNGAATGAQLFRLNTTTAALTLVGNITGIPFAIDLAIDATGQMWSHDIGGDTLLRIDKNTGAPTVVGPTGMNANFAQGMMYDHSDNTLYGCAFVIVPAQQGQLVRFNMATGAATILAGPIPDELECGVKRAAGGGTCTAPVFSGLATAQSAGTPACAINLTWPAAIPCPGTTVKYNVYRSTTAGVPPSAATLIQSCVTGLTYTDTNVIAGTRYYYKVRAEDNLTTGTGPCNSGNQDGNLVERSAVPGGPLTTTTDDVEQGGTNWNTSGGTGTNLWSIVTTEFHSPTRSWFVSDPPTVSLQPLTRTTAFAYPAGGGTWSWWHRYNTEATFDGYVAEYSLDGGTTWSDILLGQGTVPANPNRFTLNPYNATLSTGFQNPLPGRRAWSGLIAAWQEVRVDMGDFAGRNVTVRYRFGSDNSVSGQGVFVDDISFSAVGSCQTVPNQAAAPEALAVDLPGNRVYQPNETVVVQPTWRNTGAQAIALTGTLTNHTGPAGPVYTIPDGSASYGTIPVGGTANCGSNCYSVANTAATRPATHWDSTALETVNVTPTPATKNWVLHIGDSFADVPPGSPFYRFIETILHKNVTGGCAANLYCPLNSTTREQMAVFVLVAREPAGYVPAPCGATPMFADVPVTSPFCRWIEELARRGVVGGCGGGNYCPSAPATREQMAVFVLRTLDPALNPPPCGATPMFADVPASSPFCRWIEELARRGVVTGCGGGNYCPTADVSREQMSVFLSVTFGLVLYGL